jgi:hypothetical protein
MFTRIMALMLFLAGGMVAQVPQSGLVAYYPLDGNAVDASGNGYTGNVYGATFTNDRFGCPGKAIWFDGSGTYVDIPGTEAMNFSTGGVSLSTWMRLDGTQSDRCIFGKHIAGYPNGYLLNITDFGVQFFLGNFAYAAAKCVTTLGNAWHHVVGTYDGSTAKIYLDGTLAGSATLSYRRANSTTIKIGSYHTPGYPLDFMGAIDQVRIYSRALDDAEIGNLYHEAMVDETPPVIELMSPATLWPPNHKFSTFPVSEMVTSVTDECAGTVPISNVVVLSVSSNEPGDAIVIDPDCRSVQLRNERDGNGNGRVYKVRLGVSDPSGNIGIATYVVTVGHDQKDGSAEIDDGTDYVVFGNCIPPTLATSNASESRDKENAGTNMTSRFDLANYPNPFNPSTTITYRVPERARVEMSVYSSLGQLVRQLVDDIKDPGVYSVRWDGTNRDGVAVSSGIYFCKLRTGTSTLTRRMLLVK